MGLSKSCKIKLFQQTTGWSTDKMRANKKVVNAICDGTDNAITYDEQNLTEEQQAQARQNIGAANDSEVVKHIPQNLTEEQKAQARTNIGTISKEEAEALVANNAIVVATLPEPSAETMGKTYLLGPDQNDNYIRYITSYDGNTYTWVPYGSTEMDLTQYAKKDTDAIEDNLAKFDANGNPIDSGISKDDVALKNGSYDNMSVGTAKNIEGRSIVTDSFFQRTTGDDAEISNGTGQLVEVKGKSQVWNQLVEKNLINIGGIQYSDTDGDKFTVNGTPVSDGFCVNARVSFINGHKYYTRFYVNSFPENSNGYALFQVYDVNNAIIYALIANSQAENDKIVSLFINPTADSDNVSVRIRLENELTYVNTVFTYPQLFDLTLLGIDNLTTVDEVEAWLAENIGTLPYYPYNAGQVINNNFQGIESIGQNLLDPVTGKAIILGEYSDVYGNYYGITGTHGTITFTDNLGNSETITPDAEGKFELLVPGTLTVATPGEDCSVFLWWDGTKTEYTPYEVNVGKLDITHIYGKKNGAGELVQVWPTGMPGIDDIKDSIKVVDGQVVAERKIGEVDMGTLMWSYYQQYNVFISNSASVILNGTSDRVICAKYIKGNYTSDVDKVIRLESNGALRVKDTQYGTDAAIFKTAMSGVMLYYELATPEVYTDLVYQGSSLFTDGTPVTLPVNYKVDNWGIENILPKNTESQILTSKPTIICKYSIDAVEMLDTHDAEINQLGEQIEGLDERKPEKVGDYPGMSVGSANTLAGRDTKIEDFVFKALDCADGIAKLNSVRGKSLVWNQLVQNGNFADTSIWVVHSTAQFSVSNNIAAITPGAQYQGITQYIYNAGKGHKYYVAGDLYQENVAGAYIKGNLCGTNIIIPLSEVGKWVRLCNIYTSGNNTNSFFGIGSTLASGWTEIKAKNLIIVDLTLMFGAGNEPATVAEFEAMFPLPYYDYNEGEIISNKTEEVKVVGFNQWDEEWEFGRYNVNTGVPSDALTEIRSKANKPIRVAPNTSYYTKFGGATSSSRVIIFFYDVEMQFISRLTGAEGTNAVWTTPANCYYVRFYVEVTTYNHDICINLSDPAKNGTYEPYKTNTIELNLPTLTGKLNGEGDSVVVFPDGLKSAGSVYDEIVGNKAIKRVGVVDMGTLNWTLSSVSNSFYSNDIANKLFGNTNIVSPKYAITNDSWSNMPDKSIKGNLSAANIWIHDSLYSTANELKSAMNGVLLYYELATPEEYILDIPIPDTFQAYNGGTIKQLPENTNEPVTAPCIIIATFSIDAVGTIIGLPKNYISKESLQAMLNAMQSAGIIASYTMTFNENTNKYDFTFTAPNNP